MNTSVPATDIFMISLEKTFLLVCVEQSLEWNEQLFVEILPFPHIMFLDLLFKIFSAVLGRKVM